MLQREPELRASLEDIVNDSWLIEDEAGSVGTISESEIFPLVSREHLTEEEHSSVLQKMVNGDIAHRDDIIAYVFLRYTFTPIIHFAKVLSFYENISWKFDSSPFQRLLDFSEVQNRGFCCMIKFLGKMRKMRIVRNKKGSR